MSPIRNRSIDSSGPRGFTLVELLITITIMSVLAVIVIPTIRTLTRDRKVREAARVVGSVFATAREHAAVDGRAGVEIVPLANASGNYNLPLMGMRLYRLRSIPAYLGDVAGATANVLGTTAALSASNDPAGAGIRVNDYIEFNNSGVWYRIVADPIGLMISFELGDADPLPPEGVDLPFKIQRQPVRVESSAVNLPNRLFVNLAFSGHGIDGFQFRALDPSVDADDTLKVWFNRDGSVDQIRQNGSMVYPQGPIMLLICTGDGDEVDMTALDSQQYIENDNNLWVVIETNSGSVTVGRMANIDPASVTLADQLRDVRQLALNRKSAAP